MLARFNPSGTHIHKGKLKVRFDLFPDPISKTYALHHVDKLNRDYTEKEQAKIGLLKGKALSVEEEKLKALIGTHKELNPMLCHFIIIDEDMNRTQLGNLVNVMFNRIAVDELDDALSKGDRGKVSQVMSPKCGMGRPVKRANLDTLNTRFAGLGVIVGVN